MANNVQLKIGGDASGLLAAVKTAMSQIQKEADKLKITPQAKATAPGVESVREASATSRSMNQKIREEKAGMDIINRELARKKSLIDDIAKRQEAATKGSREELALAQQLNREKERLGQTEKIAQIQKENFRKAQAASDRATGKEMPGGGQPKTQGAITDLGGLAKFLGIPAGILAIGGTAIAGTKAIEGARRFFSESGVRTREIEASNFQMQGQGGQRLNAFLNGGGNQEMMFNSQRIEAAKIAENTIGSKYSNNLPKNSPMADVSKLLLGDAAGAFQHGQYMQGLRALAGNFGVTSQQKEFETRKQKEQTELQQSQFEALKNGPGGALRTAAANQFLQNWQRDLGFQRQMGQTQNRFMGFLGGVTDAGFSNEQGMGAASAIQGAGGSTRAATGNAAFALQMGRQFGLTNAGEAIGKISGQIGSSEMSKEALIKIQAEGTRIGLNQSDMREENRKFVEMAADVIGKSNVNSGTGLDQILDTFGKFMSGANTISGQDAAKSAYERYQSQSNTQSGPSAVMRSSFMRASPVLGTLSEYERSALSTLPENEITTDSELIQHLAGGDPKKAQSIVAEMHKAIGNSLFVNPETDKAVDRMKKAYSNATMMGPFQDPKELQNRQKELTDSRGAFQVFARNEGATGGLTDKQLGKYEDYLQSGDTEGMARLQADIKKQAESGDLSRPGDKMEKQQAEISRMNNAIFTSLQEAIVPATKDMAAFTTQINDLVTAMKGGNTIGIINAINALGNTVPGSGSLPPSTQPTTGSGGSPTGP